MTPVCVRVPSVAVLLLLAGCQFVAPEFESTRYRCSATPPECPTGFTCLQGVCQHGFDAVHVAATGMAQAEDAEIL